MKRSDHEALRLIFLDIDGVLNSYQYYEKLGEDHMLTEPIDLQAVARLKEIVEATGAKLVLTSSWRGGWDLDPARRSEEGQLLDEKLSLCGLSLYDKTGRCEIWTPSTRSLEIREWLRACPRPIAGFVILDDGDFAWDQNGLAGHWIRTDSEYGLVADQIPRAIAILQRKPRGLFWHNLSRRIRMLLFTDIAKETDFPRGRGRAPTF